MFTARGGGAKPPPHCQGSTVRSCEDGLSFLRQRLSGCFPAPSELFAHPIKEAPARQILALQAAGENARRNQATACGKVARVQLATMGYIMS